MTTTITKLSNEARLLPYYKKLKGLKDNSQFVEDKSGVKIVELLDFHCTLDPTQNLLKFNGRSTPEKYVKAELDWYLSLDRHVDEIGKSAKIWTQVCSSEGLVNSNYGWCIYSEDNHSQYLNCMQQLIDNKSTRRAMMIYTRPEMQQDYCKDGMSDFICTNNVQCFIRDNKLIYIVNMRSNDAILGLFNDLEWHIYVYNQLLRDLRIVYPELQASTDGLYWNAASFHIYERHFDMLDKICETVID